MNVKYQQHCAQDHCQGRTLQCPNSIVVQGFHLQQDMGKLQDTLHRNLQSYNELKLTAMTGNIGLKVNHTLTNEVSVLEEVASVLQNLAVTAAANWIEVTDLTMHHVQGHKVIITLGANPTAACLMLAKAQCNNSDELQDNGRSSTGGNSRTQHHHYCWSHGFIPKPATPAEDNKTGAVVTEER